MIISVIQYYGYYTRLLYVMGGGGHAGRDRTGRFAIGRGPRPMGWILVDPRFSGGMILGGVPSVKFRIHYHPRRRAPWPEDRTCRRCPAIFCPSTCSADADRQVRIIHILLHGHFRHRSLLPNDFLSFCTLDYTLLLSTVLLVVTNCYQCFNRIHENKIMLLLFLNREETGRRLRRNSSKNSKVFSKKPIIRMSF